MPADASIYGQIQQQRPVNRLADLAQAFQVKGLQDQNALAQYTMRKAEREDTETNALNAAYAGAVGPDGKIDRNKLFQSVAQGNMGSRLPAIQKTFADQDAAATKADTEKFKLATERYNYFKQSMGALAQEPNLTKDLVVQAGQALVQQGILPVEMYQGAVANMPDDPAQLRARLQQGLKSQMSPEKIFEVFSPKVARIDNGGQIISRDENPNSPTFGQNVGGAPIAKVMTPGEVATDRRAAALLAETKRHHGVTEGNQSAALTKPFEITGPDGNPLLVQQDKAGNIRPVQGYGPKQGASKPLNETQAKANLFGMRMKEANRILSELEDQGVTNSGVIKGVVEGAAGLTPFIGDKVSDAAGSVMNVVPGVLGGPSGDQQRVGQSKRDFINAVLRRESGAAIAASEFSNADRQYFPQPGDSKEVIAQKRRNRELAIRGLEVEVPGGFRDIPSGGPKTPAASSEPKTLRFDANGNQIP